MESIQERSLCISEFLVEQGAKAIVVACNTATAAAIELLREQFEVPIIGMEPGLKPALSQTQSNVVAVLATDNTLTSDRFHTLNQRFNSNTELVIQPCTDLVELIETGDFDSHEIDAILAKIIPDLLNKNVDTIVLGCSHYPLIRKQIEKHASPAARVIDTGNAVAREVQRRIAELDTLNQQDMAGEERFWTSLSTSGALKQMKKIWPTVRHIEKLNIQSLSPHN